MIKFCTCKHEFQDKIYGEQKRVYNKMKKKLGDKFLYRCSVCKKEQTRT